MVTTRTLKHLGYELTCGATAVDGGRFAPSLIVTKQVWPTRPRVIAVPRGDYLTHEGAVDAAVAKGIEWVSDYG